MSVERVHGAEVLLPVRPWSNRAFSMPALPGGTDAQIEVLRVLLAALRDGLPVEEPIALPGDAGGHTTLALVGQRLQPAGLVTRMGRSSWALTMHSEEWLNSGDDAYLIAILHANIRFVGELVHEAREGCTQSDLLTRAAEKYGCAWESLDQIRRRTAWLRAGGFVELDFRHDITPTESGLELVRRLELAEPKIGKRRAGKVDPVTELPAAHPLVRAQLDGPGRDRKANIGYIPRNDGDSFLTMRKFSKALTDDMSREEIDEFASAEFGLRPSSVASALGTLKAAGMVEQVGFGTYRSTDIAKACLAAPHDLDYLRVVHSKFKFVGEILEALEEVDTPRDLAALALTRYRVPREDIPEVRTRLQMLRECGLVEEVTWGHYRVLPLGRAMLADLPTDAPAALEATQGEGPTPGVEASLSPTAETLRAASRDSGSPERFEREVAEAFAHLGYDSQLFGGPGQTDVLVTAHLSGDSKYSVIVDAKSSASGKIGETQVNFDTLKEHRAANSAEYILVVGPGFPGSRLAARAEAHGVGLLDVETLISIVEHHAQAPLTLQELRDVCSRVGVVESGVLEKRWSAEKRMYRLCDRVLRQLATEAASADAVTTGALSAHDLYLIFRSEVENPPTPHEIESVLKFLSSEIIHAIRKVGSQYSILEDPGTTARRLNLLAASVAGQASARIR
ncbi:restriction endonuclease [Streptomyces amritsarensis]|uniref:restriction endonuclease n=1 Tax=Streptomyces amritsarensis TaxID=681158 RepID=UPI00117E2612|nr:restriction endonuclease [Streptomyces amritsarensis]